MTYSANNPEVYGSALAGALSGMGVFGRQPTETNPVNWASSAAIAGAWAQEFDTIWGTTTVNEMIVQMIEQMSSDWWATRSGVGTADDLLPATYSASINALAAAIGAANTYVAAQGVDPTPIAGRTVTAFKLANADPNQTLLTTPVLKDNAVTVVDIEILGKIIGSAEAVSTKIQYTFYRDAGGPPQQVGTPTVIVAVTGTLGLDGSTFDVTGSGNALIVRGSPETTGCLFKTVVTLTNN